MTNLSYTQQLLNTLQDESLWRAVYDRIELKDRIPNEELRKLNDIILTNDYKKYAEDLVYSRHQWSTPEKLLLAKAGTTKKRVVYMYNQLDRFLLGALFKAFNIVFNDKFAPNCFSYRKGMSTVSAIEYIAQNKDHAELYGLKLDISAYFNSIDKQHLLKCIYELFPNQEQEPILQTMLDLFDNEDITYKGRPQQEYKAMIPGCALGSFFANYCLRELDHHFHDNKVIYARYSDDIIILDESPELIEEHLTYIKTKLVEYGLTINEKKYVHFQPNEPVEYLGLALTPQGIDIGKHAKKKLKKTIHRWVKAARKEIELGNTSFERVAPKVVNRLNWKLYKSYIKDPRKFGWAYYIFRYLTLTDSLLEIDYYLRDQLRYLKTGKHNKANVKAIDDEGFRQLGVLSLFEMFHLFRTDFDYYCEIIDLV